MSTGALLAIDLVAVLLLAFGLYFPRYQRRDMVVALLGINIGVMAVATALANAEVSAGVGLGLFGVLSIIREFPVAAHVAGALALFSSVMTLFWYILQLVGVARD